MTQYQLFSREEPKIGDVEESLRAQGIKTIIGVDEAGRGPLAGPVYAAAVWMDLEGPLPEGLSELDDSKKLDESLREKLFEGLQATDWTMAISDSDAGVVDEINILQATFRAMRRAVDEVIEAAGEIPDLVLIDGNMILPGAPWPQRSVIKGDARSLTIAAASVLAKVSRDRFMRQADEEWPHYGFASNKGYGTRAHREAIKVHGPCVLHRRSFAGVIQEG